MTRMKEGTESGDVGLLFCSYPRNPRLNEQEVCIAAGRPILVCKENEGDDILPARAARSGCATFHMPIDLPETSTKIEGPLVKQFSIFLPNKAGAMLDVVKLLHTHDTHVVALSISESTDSAIARILVSDPDRVENLFHEHNVAFG